ncbi:MAG: serine/threonine-protein kinase [Myxococcota bacterium]
MRAARDERRDVRPLHESGQGRVGRARGRIEDLPELRQDEVLGRAFGLRAGPDGGTESAASGLVRDLEFVCDYAAQFERVAPYQAHVTRIIERLVGARALRFATAEHAPSEHGLDLVSLVRHGLAALSDEPRRARIGTAPLRVDGVPAWLREALPVRRFGRLLFDLREGVDPGEAVTHSGIDAADAESALALTILTGVATTVAAPPEAPSPPPVAPAPRRYFDELHAMADEAARSGARRRLAGTRFEPAGERIGDILLFYRVGSGGSGTVFLGLQLGIGGFAKTVAVKRLLDTRVGDPAARNAFLAEARIVACLQHPNIATTFGLTLHDDQEFMVMEFIHGVPLDLFLSRAAARGATIPDALVRYIGSEVARGLDYLHSRVDPDGRPLNFVHRDIAPPNVLLGFDGSVKLIDFSIAHSDAHELQAIDPRARAGRRCYMAPEVARGHAIDFRADQFGLAATLFELATGRRRVGPTTPGASAASGEPHGGSVLARAPNVSPRLAYIIERGLAPEREDRFPSADAFRDALLKDGLDGDPINLQREILASHFGALCAREQDAIRRMRRGAAEVLPLHVAGSAGAISPGQPLDLVEGGPEPGR